MNKFYLFYFMMSMFLYSCANDNKSIKIKSLDVHQFKKAEAVLDTQPKEIETNTAQEDIEVSRKVTKEEPEVEKTNQKAAAKITNTPKNRDINPPLKSKSSPIISFEQDKFDFGRIVQGEKVLHEFVFHNKGNAPLVIKNAEASCGCTKPIYPFIPIEAGAKGTILVQFNSTGRLGRQAPKIDVVSNATDKIVSLHLSGEVVTKEFQDSLR